MSKTAGLKCFIFVICILGQLVLNSQCAENGTVWDKSWISCTETNNPNPARASSLWLLFEFERAESISTSKIWNANRSGESSMGIKTMYVDYSIDGLTWQSQGIYSVGRAPESIYYNGTIGPNLEGMFVKKILFTVESTYGHPSCASLAEVQFNIEPNSCYGIIDECGVCDGPGEITWYLDFDNDGLGDPDEFLNSCTQPVNYVANADDECDTGVYGWSEIGPLFEENGCTGCHGNSGGLDLTSYSGISTGGYKCGPNLLTGNNLVGVITIQGYDYCSSEPISGPPMNDRVGGAMDDSELAMIQAWVDSGAPEFCQCLADSPDSDNDGVCDDLDSCPGFDNQLIGTACDDSLPCTMNDVIDIHCNCVGEPALDSDDDGVCDAQDASPFEPCTADGTIDGIEPTAWTGSVNNDCDLDGVPLGQGDLDDFQACINLNGFVPSPACTCNSNMKIGGGQFASHFGVGNSPQNGAGQPDGVLSGAVSDKDRLFIEYPYMAKNTEICFQLGFSEVDGAAYFELNDIGTYIFVNTAGIIDFGMQEFCFYTIEDGSQTILIKEFGSGYIRVDGSSFEYCECSITDPEELSPDCQCPNNQFQSTGDFDSIINEIVSPENAAGQPDNVFTNNLSHLDTLILNYPQLEPSTKICVTAGFNDALGVIHFKQSGKNFLFPNKTGDVTFAPQEFCFVVPDVLTDNLLHISEYGSGWIKVDGSIAYACNPCEITDPDSDGDGICDANDPCPNSVTNDYDNDGVCDDIDICLGFDDGLDSDGDGVPNGCDICPGGNDSVDSDSDGVPNTCDQCPGNDDAIDSDFDGIPNACDMTPCLNFITEIDYSNLLSDQSANFQILSNGNVRNNRDLEYSAGQNIFFDKGFEVRIGSTFQADIEPCTN